MSAREFKIIVIGKDGVGKSNLVLRFVTGQPPPENSDSIEDTYRKVKTHLGMTIVLEIMDTTGDNLSAFGEQFARSCTGILAVYSICDRNSFDTIQATINQVLRIKDADLPMVIVGTHLDKEKDRQVENYELRSLAGSFRTAATFFEIAACATDDCSPDVWESLISSMISAGSQNKVSVQNASGCQLRRRKQCCSIMSDTILSEENVAGGFASHPSSAPDPLECFSVQLESNALAYYSLVQKFDSQPLLANKTLLGNSFIRYKRFLKLRSRGVEIAPTIDILAIWHSHMIRPEMYARDCQRLCGRELLELDFPLKQISEQNLQISAAVYEKEYMGEKYLCSLDELQSVVLEDSEEKIELTADLIVRDREWIRLWENEVSAEKELTADTIRSCIKQYEMYLYLLARYPSAVKDSEASMRVDLVWHSHMLAPKAYRSDCERLLGFYLKHEPWPTQKEDEKMNRTCLMSFEQLWKQEFRSLP